MSHLGYSPEVGSLVGLEAPPNGAASMRGAVVIDLHDTISFPPPGFDPELIC